MRNWRSKVLQNFKISNCSPIVFPLLISVTILSAADVARSQGLPGPGIRERNRVMDDHDRDINRMKNDAKMATEHRRNLFPQINEDFQRIQVIHNEIVRILQSEKGLDYGRLANLTDDMKKRSSRLRENLALPEREKTDTRPTHTETVDETHMKKTIVALHDLVVSFVGNPIFKNLAVVDAKVIEDARANLDHIIDVSDEIKREAKMLGKSATK
ncbi:MAG TPA: hypothetical protein VFH46_21875 [Pyrinomonadaceae bacterium]|nr:hypothetical protein [Pyrinomonadaceae bacterium]